MHRVFCALWLARVLLGQGLEDCRNAELRRDGGAEGKSAGIEGRDPGERRDYCGASVRGGVCARAGNETRAEAAAVRTAQLYTRDESEEQRRVSDVYKSFNSKSQHQRPLT